MMEEAFDEKPINHRAITQSIAINYLLAEAATEESSGFFTGERELTMGMISNAIFSLVTSQKIGLLTVDPEHISGPIVAGTFTSNGDKKVVIAFRSTLVDGYRPEEIEQRMREMVEQGLFDPIKLVQKLYQLVEKDVVWE